MSSLSKVLFFLTTFSLMNQSIKATNPPVPSIEMIISQFMTIYFSSLQITR